MKELKVQKGDKLLCKKSTFDGNLGVIENKWYTVIKVDKLPPELSGFTLDVKFTLFAQVNDGGVYNYNFCLHDNNKNYIWDYFYTVQELRKTKLKKIENR